MEKSVKKLKIVSPHLTISVFDPQRRVKNMTKQEYIKEMVSIMAASNNPFVDVPIEIMPKVAEALYNAGYRKLHKDSKE